MYNRNREGSLFRVGSETMKFCPNCGKEVSEDTKFCPNCGKRLIEIQGKQIATSEEVSEEFKDMPDSILLEHITLQLSPRYCGKCGCQLKARWLQKKCFDRQTGYPKYDVIIACPHATLYETRISSKLLVIFESPFNRHTAGRVSLVIPPEADSVISNMGEEWAKNIHNNSLGIWSLILGIIGILTFSGLAGALAAIVLGILQFRHHVSKCSIAGVVLGVFGVVLFIVP